MSKDKYRSESSRNGGIVFSAGEGATRSEIEVYSQGDELVIRCWTGILKVLPEAANAIRIAED